MSVGGRQFWCCEGVNVQSDLPVFKDYGFTRIKERTLGTIYDEMAEQDGGR